MPKKKNSKEVVKKATMKAIPKKPSKKFMRLVDGVRNHCSGLSPARKQELLDFALSQTKKNAKSRKSSSASSKIMEIASEVRKKGSKLSLPRRKKLENSFLHRIK